MAPALDGSSHVIVVGLGFGDEGKGSLVDALCRRAPRPPPVVRFNGGPQAAHHVVTPGGGLHCFAQLGSGLLAGSPASASSHHVLVEPASALREAEALAALGVERPLARLRLDARSVVVTPPHRLLNRAHELVRGQGRHGSCGLGVGQAFMDALNPEVPTVRLGELRDPPRLARKLGLMRLQKLDLVEQLADASGADLAPVLAELRRPELVGEALARYARFLDQVGSLDEGQALASLLERPVVFEGAQGVLLDADGGFWPHVTPSTTTFANALSLLAPGEPRPFRLGALRACSTRHGAGPFVAGLPPSSPEAARLLDGDHNAINAWQGAMRAGWFDLVLARYALDLCGGVDGLAVTCLDRLAGLDRVGVVEAWRLADPLPEGLAEVCAFEAVPGGAVVRRLRRPAAGDRRHQGLLTALASRAGPVVRWVDGWAPGGGLPAAARRYLDLIERELEAPVALISAGPTADDKRFTAR